MRFVLTSVFADVDVILSYLIRGRLLKKSPPDFRPAVL